MGVRGSRHGLYWGWRMTQLPPAPEFAISPEARADAVRAVSTHVHWLDNGLSRFWTVERDALIADVAAVIQQHVNAVELAEIERRQAVDRAQALRDELGMLSRRGVESWARCTRCGMRGPSVAELQHLPHCTLRSSLPPAPVAPAAQESKP